MSASIWPKSSPKRVDRAISAHSVMGIVAGALLYLVCLSGAIVVFENEIEWWEEADAPRVAALTPDAVQAAAETALAADPEPTSHLYVYPPTPDSPRAIAATDGVSLALDAEGRTVRELHRPWAEFLVALHLYLHLPSTIGIMLVGALGAVMLGLTISGFLAHPRIFREAFAMRRDGSERIAEIDVHNRLSVWTAPFQIAVSFTGALIGLYFLIGAVVAQVGFDGDAGALTAAVFGDEPAEDETPAPVANVAAAMAYMAETHPETTPILAVVHEPGTAGQHLQVLATHPGRLIYGEYYNFDADGRFVETLGMADGALGRQVAMSIYRVHFGWFGGPLVKVAYAALGLALCVVIASGLNIYFIKRREKGREARRLNAMWAAVVWGAPLALAGALLASMSGAFDETGVKSAFWLVLAATVLVGAAWPNRRALSLALRGGTGVALLVAAGVHAATHGVADNPPVVVAIELAVTLAGVLLLGATAAAMSRRRVEPAAALDQPAE